MFQSTIFPLSAEYAFFLNFTTYFNPYPTTKTSFCFVFTSAAYIQEHFRLDFIMEANTMIIINPDQTPPLLHIVCKIGYLRNKQMREQMAKVMTGGKRVKKA